MTPQTKNLRYIAHDLREGGQRTFAAQINEAANRLEQLESESIACLLKLAAMEDIIKERDQLKDMLNQGEAK